mgnify:CR=1 FL=1
MRDSDSVGKAVAKRGLGGLFGGISNRLGDFLADVFLPKEGGKVSKSSNELTTNFKLKVEGIQNRLVQMDQADMSINKETGEAILDIKDPVLYYILTGDNSKIRSKK